MINQRNPTGLKGVRYTKGGRYEARIRHRGKQYFLGSFITAEAAAREFDKATRLLPGHKVTQWKAKNEHGLKGRRFDSLEVLERVARTKDWHCRCDCGELIIFGSESNG